MQSHVSTLLELAANVYKDAAAGCTAVNPFDLRDLETIRSRVNHEGLSFLTITLPSLGVDLERSLHEGGIGSTCFRSFKKHGRVPAFLQGFLIQVFDQGTGRILNEPSISAIEGVRQIAYTFKKVKIACAPFRVRKALRQFKQIEHDLDRPIDSQDIADFVQISDVLWTNVLAHGDFSMGTMRPKHGPGSTEERIMGNQKYVHQIWHSRLEPYFPMCANAYSSESVYGSKEFDMVDEVLPEQEHPVRVITVPKTLKTPRIIAIEPVCMQYTQQAVSRQLTSCLESTVPTKGHVNFTDQGVNRQLAITSSKSGQYATLDLSAASDRVPLSLSMRMFDGHPDLQGAIFACRSMKARLPDGEVLNLRKFASMGSALCFPIEAMYFYTICVLALLKKRNLPVSYPNCCIVGHDVYVYGDDILVPSHEAVFVADYLHKYHCKVGLDKSFWKGNFRESCGMDAFFGEEVTPTYIRELPPSNKRDANELISWIATANLFYHKGYWSAARYMRSHVERYLGQLPLVRRDSEGLGWESVMPYLSVDIWRGKYQVVERGVHTERNFQHFAIKTWVAKPVRRTDELEDFAALTKSLLMLESRGDEILTEADHLLRTARSGAVTLKRQWTSVY